ncbi:MAG TPA: rhodanese-like domain-containing protein [Tepidisphaeraceae bacterium]|nr:rhodanese-like domain-containing protein [Tepidisphaeraceae bacterium]
MNPLRTLALVLALVAPPAFAADKPAAAPAPRVVDPAEFEKIAAKEGVVVLDVRTPEEWKSGVLKNAVLIDFKAPDFADRIKALDKSKTYAVYCRSGRRSASACDLMKAAGFATLHDLGGGILAWEKAGKPVKK